MVIRDTIDPVSDEHLAEFVVNSHIRSHPQYEEGQEDDVESKEEEEKPTPNEVHNSNNNFTLLEFYLKYSLSTIAIDSSRSSAEVYLVCQEEGTSSII